jgi:DNA primase
VARIKPEELTAIKDKLDIVDVISQYQPLQKKGKVYKGICPFHDDHDPSMTVNPDMQIFKCFVCGTGGDIFRYVSLSEQISFPEAVAKMADQAGIALSSHPTAAPSSPNQPLWDILSGYIQYTHYLLENGNNRQLEALLEKRHLSDEICALFEIGYAPAKKDSRHYFQSKGLKEGMLQDAGLVGEEGEPLFANRLMIPIHDAYGHPIGFTARQIEEDGPKYINSPGTALFSKGDILFNYHRAKPAARKAGRIVVVEGAMDVIGMAKGGMLEAVAGMGTAFTSSQMYLLQALQVPVVVFFDNDSAGQAAAYAFGKKAMEAGLSFSLAAPISEKDPDELVDRQGREALVQAVNRTRSYVDFLFEYLQSKYSLDNYEDRKKYAQEIQDCAKVLCTDFELPSVAARIKELTGFDMSQAPVKRRAKKRMEPMPVSMPEQGIQKAEKEALRQMLVSRQAAAKYKEEVGFFHDKSASRLALHLYDAYRSQEEFSPLALMHALEDQSLQDYLAGLMEEGLPDYDPEVFEGCIQLIQIHALNEQISHLNAQIRDCLDPAQKIKLASRKRELIIARDNKMRDEKEG